MFPVIATGFHCFCQDATRHLVGAFSLSIGLGIIRGWFFVNYEEVVKLPRLENVNLCHSQVLRGIQILIWLVHTIIFMSIWHQPFMLLLPRPILWNSPLPRWHIELVLFLRQDLWDLRSQYPTSQMVEKLGFLLRAFCPISVVWWFFGMDHISWWIWRCLQKVLATMAQLVTPFFWSSRWMNVLLLFQNVLLWEWLETHPLVHTS